MFDLEKKAVGLDTSTFDIIEIDSFHNTRFWTVLSFVWVWVVIILKIAILGGDTYTCVSILVFDRWSTLDYDVYEYKVAKWIFTGCVFFRFILLAYQTAWGIHIYRTRNIALAYLNHYARLMYAIRSYNYQCLFHEIDQDGFFEWACFHVYAELDNALEVLVADLPRQVINFMTLRYYATGGDLNNDILANIKSIATTNLRLSIILSFQLCTMVLFLFFFLKFLFALILFIPIKVKVANRGFRLLKAFCYKSVNENVRLLVKRNHKPRTQIINEGVLSMNEVQANLLLASHSTFDLNTWSKPPVVGVGPLETPNSSQTNLHDNSFGDGSFEYYPLLVGHRPQLQETYSLSTIQHNPFEDRLICVASNRNTSLSIVEENPFADFPAKAISKITRIPPPGRSQTSESLLSMRAAPGKQGDDIVGSHHRLYLGDMGTLQSLGNVSLSNDRTKNSSKSNLMNPGLLLESEDSHECSRITINTSSIDSHSKIESSDQTQAGPNEGEPIVDNLLSVIEANEDTPYPVRGVSQYFDENGG